MERISGDRRARYIRGCETNGYHRIGTLCPKSPLTIPYGIKLSKVRTYVLPERLRIALGQPIGDLLVGKDIDLEKVLRELVAKERPPKLILVGDTVSRRAIHAGLVPDVVIIDNKEKRKPSIKFEYPSGRVIKARNQAGKIEPEAQMAVERAILGEADRVEIDGEEDLLALIAARAAPIKSVVVYGQPNEGVVLVRVSAETRTKVNRILDQMG